MAYSIPRQGSITLTNGSATVTATGTNWSGSADYTLNVAGGSYVVESINSIASLTLRDAWAGATVTTSVFDLVPVQAPVIGLKQAFDAQMAQTASLISGAAFDERIEERVDAVLERAESISAIQGSWPASAATVVPRGVTSVTLNAGGTGGQSGTFNLGITGGGGQGATGSFTVVEGVVTAVQITAPGYGYTSAPTLSFSASAALTGVSATAVISHLVKSGETYWAPSSDGLVQRLYQNINGSPVLASAFEHPSRAVVEAADQVSTQLSRDWASKALGLDVDSINYPGTKSSRSYANESKVYRDATAVLATNSYVRIESLEQKLAVLMADKTYANGDVIFAEVMGPTGAPAEAGNTPLNGAVLHIRLKGITLSSTWDMSKLKVRQIQPGFGPDKVYNLANIITENRVTSIYRRPYPNGASKLAFQNGADVDLYLALEDYVYVGDRLYGLEIQAGFYGACTTSRLGEITNRSTRDYEMPVVDLLAMPQIARMGSSGLYCEWIVSHHAARNGKPVAAVDLYVNDNRASPQAGHESSVAVNTVIASTLVGPYKPPVYAGTIPSTGLTSGKGGASIRVYPWVSGPTPWDLASHGAASVLDTHIAAYHPVEVDLDNSFAYARGYVSHTGAQIGSPTLTTGALAAYEPGVTPAFASVSALYIAGKAWNNNATNRARVHNDIDSIEAVIPGGVQIAGFGASINNQTTHTVADGPLPRITKAAGADILTTGISAASTAANKVYRHLELVDISLFPGAAGAATHVVVDGSTGNATTNPGSVQNTVMFRASGVRCVGNNDTAGFDVIYRSGYRYFHNCTFSGIGNGAMRNNWTYWQGLVIHGGTYSSTDVNAVDLADVFRVAGGQFTQYVPNAEQSTRVIQPMVGQTIVFNRFDFNTTGGGPSPNLGSKRAAVGARGFAFIGNIILQRCLPTVNTKPSLQISSDYAHPYDHPAVRNGLVFCNTILGGRYNRLYIEARKFGSGATSGSFNDDIKEIYERFNIFEQENTKGDYMIAGSGLAADASRTGNFPFRHATGRRGNRNAVTAANTSIYSPDSWLGEVQAPQGAVNLGYANIVIDNPSTFGSNTGQGNLHPRVACANAIPAGWAPIPFDANGVTVANDGTGYAGAWQPAA